MISGAKLFEIAQRTLSPFQADLVGYNSVDVTLGDTFYLPTEFNSHHLIDLSALPSEDDMYEKVVVQRYLELPPQRFIKALTAEKFDMDSATTGMFTLRSAIAQAGLDQSTSVWIRSSWRGYLVLELSNITNKTLILRPGLRIGQVHFFSTH